MLQPLEQLRKSDVLVNPADVMADTSVNSRVVGVSTSNTPGNNSVQITVAIDGSTRITLYKRRHTFDECRERSMFGSSAKQNNSSCAALYHGFVFVLSRMQRLESYFLAKVIVVSEMQQFHILNSKNSAFQKQITCMKDQRTAGLKDFQINCVCCL